MKKGIFLVAASILLLSTAAWAEMPGKSASAAVEQKAKTPVERLKEYRMEALSAIAKADFAVSEAKVLEAVGLLNSAAANAEVAARADLAEAGTRLGKIAADLKAGVEKKAIEVETAFQKAQNSLVKMEKLKKAKAKKI